MQSVGMPSKQSLNAATTTGTGTALPLHQTAAKFGLQVTLGGTVAATGAVVALEGSINGADWITIGTSWTLASNPSGSIVWFVDKPVCQVRANCTTLSGGTAPTISAWICAC